MAQDNKNGGKLTLIGEGTEDAVICTGTSTFSIKKVDMSNSMYLLDASCNNKFEIIGSAGHFYEVIDCAI